MREIERTGRFRRDYKREAKTYGPTQLDAVLIPVLRTLGLDQPLADKYQDHLLTGDWDNHRDCHIKPDLPEVHMIFLKIVLFGIYHFDEPK